MTHAQSPIRGPFMGVVSDLISPQGPPNDFDDVVNFFVRKGRIQTRPVLGPFTAADPLTRYIGNFQDANGNFHTFRFVNYVNGQTPAYFLSAPPPTWNPLTSPAMAAGQLGSSLPFNDAHIQNQVYFANGGYPLMYLDGSNACQIAGDVPGTCQFLAVNVNHLIMANCTEPAPGTTGSAAFPRRVRWSGSGNPLEWNPVVDFTAGSNDLLDVPDNITGLNTLGRNTYVWRTNGVTVMFPTGIGLAPFDFENYSIAPDGIGNIFPYALATYNNQCIFIARDDIYLFDGTSFTSITGTNQSAIGGLNRKRLYADLAANTGDVVWGRIVPNLTLGFDMLSYWLTIPGPNVTWVYTFDDGQWVRFTSSHGYLTALRSVYTT